VDQIELPPAVPRRDTVAYLAGAGIVPQAWSPLGLSHGVPGSAPVTAVARDRGVTPAQVVLRWAGQQGIAVIPKSASPHRQRANLDIFGWALTDAEMAALAGLDRGEDAAVDSDLRVEY
jgi:2,5-diketo-D-gluconate reductase A